MASVAINSQLNLGTDPVQARSWVLSDLGPVLAKAGYRTTATSSESVTFTRRHLPGWAIVVGILTLPFGILILALVRSTDALVVDLGISGGFVLATAAGTGPKMVRDLMEKLNREGVVMRAAATPTETQGAAQERPG
ncbi:MAG TPA: hypothetical protein VGC63_04845 [Solirubrobacterales bacterium]|jgi:hypothetical protein